ncbi:hypothetical protein BYT27DRAFT_7325263 [Phlegmacium glaucopus]|nr:hypothetical protein BYT27DRAFT_7325263 [Phlegmacium glaucopus]
MRQWLKAIGGYSVEKIELAGASYTGQATYICTCTNDDKERAVVLASMNLYDLSIIYNDAENKQTINYSICNICINGLAINSETDALQFRNDDFYAMYNLFGLLSGTPLGN